MHLAINKALFYPQLSDDNERNIRFYIHAFAYGHQFLQWAIQQQIEFEHEILWCRTLCLQ